jgi:hypothetical protein
MRTSFFIIQLSCFIALFEHHFTKYKYFVFVFLGNRNNASKFCGRQNDMICINLWYSWNESMTQKPTKFMILRQEQDAFIKRNEKKKQNKLCRAQLSLSNKLECKLKSYLPNNFPHPFKVLVIQMKMIIFQWIRVERCLQTSLVQHSKVQTFFLSFLKTKKKVLVIRMNLVKHFNMPNARQ